MSAVLAEVDWNWFEAACEKAVGRGMGVLERAMHREIGRNRFMVILQLSGHSCLSQARFDAVTSNT